MGIVLARHNPNRVSGKKKYILQKTSKKTFGIMLKFCFFCCNVIGNYNISIARIQSNSKRSEFRSLKSSTFVLKANGYSICMKHSIRKNSRLTRNSDLNISNLVSSGE